MAVRLWSGKGEKTQHLQNPPNTPHSHSELQSNTYPEILLQINEVRTHIQKSKIIPETENHYLTREELQIEEGKGQGQKQDQDQNKQAGELFLSKEQTIWQKESVQGAAYKGGGTGEII